MKGKYKRCSRLVVLNLLAWIRYVHVPICYGSIARPPQRFPSPTTGDSSVVDTLSVIEVILTIDSLILSRQPPSSTSRVSNTDLAVAFLLLPETNFNKLALQSPALLCEMLVWPFRSNEARVSLPAVFKFHGVVSYLYLLPCPLVVAGSEGLRARANGKEEKL
jgi:hypothetical protein